MNARTEIDLSGPYPPFEYVIHVCDCTRDYGEEAECCAYKTTDIPKVPQELDEYFWYARIAHMMEQSGWFVQAGQTKLWSMAYNEPNGGHGKPQGMSRPDVAPAGVTNFIDPKVPKKDHAVSPTQVNGSPDLPVSPNVNVPNDINGTVP